MSKRYRPRTSFTTYVNGVRRTFTPGYVHPRTKLQGYTDADLKGLAKNIRASFEEIPAEYDDEPAEVVEQATAAPGEKRSVKRTTKRAAATDK